MIDTSYTRITITANSISSVKTYRKSLLNFLSSEGYQIKYCNNLKVILSSFNPVGKRRVKISSDGRSNLITLMSSAGPSVIIFNGFGRYESSKFIRGLIIKLIKVRKNSHICIQSYRDFRFLRRFCDENQLNWIIGSGGTMRQTAPLTTEKKLVITRAKKFPLLEKRLLDFRSLGAIDIIGLDTKWSVWVKYKALVKWNKIIFLRSTKNFYNYIIMVKGLLTV